MQQAGLSSFPPPSALGNLTSRSPTLLYRLTVLPPPANCYNLSLYTSSPQKKIYSFFLRTALFSTPAYLRIAGLPCLPAPSSRRFRHGGSASTAYALGLNYRAPACPSLLYISIFLTADSGFPPPQSALTLLPSSHISLSSEGDSPPTNYLPSLNITNFHSQAITTTTTTTPVTSSSLAKHTSFLVNDSISHHSIAGLYFTHRPH